MAEHTPKVYIVLLNWNGWQDTIECLESIFHNSYSNYSVIVCDNASEDGSLDYVKAWARGALDVILPLVNPLRKLVLPPVTKPIPFAVFDSASVEAGGHATVAGPSLVLIQNAINLGFAAGNNVGLRYALACGDAEYVWLLNNDTVIDRDALAALIDTVQQHPAAGLCGSTLAYYQQPQIVQAMGGGIYNKWLAKASHIGEGQPIREVRKNSNTQVKMAYVVGASMLVSKAFLQNVGLMSEEYFLYFEEIDWALRAQDRYELLYVPNSIVYHKEGASTGGKIKSGHTKSYVADFYNIRSRLLFTHKFYRWAMPTVYLGLLGALVNRIRRHQWDRCRMILRLMLRPGHR